MSHFFVFFVIVIAVTLAMCNSTKIPLIGTDTALFDKFEKNFNMKFQNPGERLKRLGIFAKNLIQMKKLNLLNPETEFGINEYSAMTEDEFKNRLMPSTWSDQFGAMNFTAEEQTDEIPSIRQKRQTIPTNFDWRTYQKVTAVRNQGSCGCCWSFATVAAMESHYAIQYGQLIGLSEQQLLDCDTVNAGCNGGWPYYAMQYIKQNGLKLLNYYAYTGVKGACRAYGASGSSYFISNLKQLPADENGVVNYIYFNGPVTMCFTFPSSMQYYVSGIVTLTQAQCEAQKSGAHAVTIIGFGTTNGVPYFTAKNSWGLNWGEQGFFRFKRNVNFCNFTPNLVAPVF